MPNGTSGGCFGGGEGGGGDGEGGGGDGEGGGGDGEGGGGDGEGGGGDGGGSLCEAAGVVRWTSSRRMAPNLWAAIVFRVIHYLAREGKGWWVWGVVVFGWTWERKKREGLSRWQ